MNTHPSNPRLRRVFTFVALAAALGLTAVTLTQCRLLDDSVTGVDARTVSGFNSGRSKCVHQCNEKFKACREKEDALHRANQRKCETFTNSVQREGCMRSEETRHTAVHEACVREMQRCKKDCVYREGSGGGGR